MSCERERRSTHTDRGDKAREDETETGSVRPIRGRRKAWNGVSLGASRGGEPCRHLDFGPLASSCFKPPCWWQFVREALDQRPEPLSPSEPGPPQAAFLRVWPALLLPGPWQPSSGGYTVPRGAVSAHPGDVCSPAQETWGPLWGAGLCSFGRGGNDVLVHIRSVCSSLSPFFLSDPQAAFELFFSNF